MGRKRTGSIRPVGPNAFEVRIAGKQVGTFDEATAQRMLRASLDVQVGAGPQIFSGWSDEWLERRELAAMRRGRVESFAKDKSRWRAHVEPAAFYHWPFKRMTVQVAQQWVHTLSDTEAMQAITFGRGSAKRTELRPTGHPISRKVVSESLNLVQLCVDAAIRAGKMQGLIVDGKIVAGNVFRMVLLPQDDIDDDDGELIVHLSTDEIEALAGSELTTFQRAVITVAIYAGLRRGELWGLRWQDVTLDGPQPEVRIRRSYDGPTKTRNSRRDVPLLPPAIDALNAWRNEQRDRIGAALVFPGEDGKCFSRGYDAGWRDHPQRRADGEVHVTLGLRARAGIRQEVSFKELRHTCGCHLAQGSWLGRRLDLHEIKTWLGHSSIAVTERHYATMTANNLHNAVVGAGFVGYTWGRKNDHTR